MREYNFTVGGEEHLLLNLLDKLRDRGIERYLVTNRDKGIYIIRTDEKEEGSILVDEYEHEWLVVLYQGDTLRVVNKVTNHLSDAEGKTLPQLIADLKGIEELTDVRLKIGGS
jgi:hypothetical protein